MHKPLLLALLLLVVACEHEAPSPDARRRDARLHDRERTERSDYDPTHPGFPYPEPKRPDNLPSPPPMNYSVENYVEADTLIAEWRDRTDGQLSLAFVPELSILRSRVLTRPDAETAATDSAAYVRQALLRGEDGKLRKIEQRVYALLMNAAALRADLVRADGSLEDVSHRTTLTYRTHEPYIKSRYSATAVTRYTRRFDEMNAYHFLWLDPTEPTECRLPQARTGESFRISLARSDGRVLRCEVKH